jgi:hypothetical protein
LRSYLFTGIERRRLREWLETHREDNETWMLFTELRRNLAPIRRDIELKVAAGFGAYTSDVRAPKHKISVRI